MNQAESEKDFESIKRLLKDACSIFIVAHIRPDGDAIGSLVGMGAALKEAGKQVQLVLQDPVPARYGSRFVAIVAGRRGRADQPRRLVYQQPCRGPEPVLPHRDAVDWPRRFRRRRHPRLVGYSIFRPDWN